MTSEEYCEPCGYLGYRVKAVQVIGTDFTPVCAFHAERPFSARPPRQEEMETHVPRKGMVGDIVGVEFHPDDVKDGRIVVRVAVEGHHRIGAMAVEIVPL